ncbi:nuclear transport factor 2 family protein [Saprospira sp. CCB-QB6]|uniref:nuclear transport factor 2 family protein n=1 Tax=Saprospira sp. CCB-QB6 TaxID=3023936 RepID=UPI002349CBC4|nr:nuclear transport factor 2 family protein [Saprospira sp. CCB-QB6]WCL80651.1 nuclear transport factor 2 family protein [Saprospira sp. CCB-QB6]
MKNLCFLLGLVLLHSSLWAQKDERPALIATVDSFFVYLHTGDSAQMRSLLAPQMELLTVAGDKVQRSPLPAFLMAIARQPRLQEWEEKLWDYRLQIDGPLATVWTPYSFYLDGNLSHCGANHFTLRQKADGQWQIISLVDSRRRENCLEQSWAEESQAKIDTLMDQWHLAAKEADADGFFGKMTKEGIYIGTDASERWYRDELRSWAKGAFKQAPAWDFSVKERHVRIDEQGGKTAWADELLDTWMGPCRATAVLSYQNGEWKIEHYQLSMTVPNEKVKAYLKWLKQK